LWEAVRTGCAISEVPITFVEREFGASKLRLPILVESALLPWRLVLSRVPVTYTEGASRRPSSAVR
jgi:dolichol-phosphate mannosyltransferase